MWMVFWWALLAPEPCLDWGRRDESRLDSAGSSGIQTKTCVGTACHTVTTKAWRSGSAVEICVEDKCERIDLGPPRGPALAAAIDAPWISVTNPRPFLKQGGLYTLDDVAAIDPITWQPVPLSDRIGPGVDEDDIVLVLAEGDSIAYLEWTQDRVRLFESTKTPTGFDYRQVWTRAVCVEPLEPAKPTTCWPEALSHHTPVVSASPDRRGHVVDTCGDEECISFDLRTRKLERRPRHKPLEAAHRSTTVRRVGRFRIDPMTQLLWSCRGNDCRVVPLGAAVPVALYDVGEVTLVETLQDTDHGSGEWRNVPKMLIAFDAKTGREIKRRQMSNDTYVGLNVERYGPHLTLQLFSEGSPENPRCIFDPRTLTCVKWVPGALGNGSSAPLDRDRWMFTYTQGDEELRRMAFVDFATRTVKTMKPDGCWSEPSPRAAGLPRGGAVLSYDESSDCTDHPTHVIATYDPQMARTSVTRIPYCE